MKNIFYSACLLMALPVSAQKEGTIQYKETVKMQIELDSATKAMIGASFPSEQSSDRILRYNQEHSLYRNAPKKEETEAAPQGDGNGPQIMIKMDEPDNLVYVDLKKNQRTESNDFMGRRFLIDNAGAKNEWKTTGETKTILGYPCLKATQIMNDPRGGKDTVVAWFTSSIPVSIGPSKFGGLPGMILEVNSGNGRRVITATNVDFKTPEAKEIKKPKEGKKVTQEEYDKIVAEKMKEMSEQYGGKGNVIIKIDHN